MSLDHECGPMCEFVEVVGDSILVCMKSGRNIGTVWMLSGEGSRSIRLNKDRQRRRASLMAEGGTRSDDVVVADDVSSRGCVYDGFSVHFAPSKEPCFDIIVPPGGYGRIGRPTSFSDVVCATDMSVATTEDVIRSKSKGRRRSRLKLTLDEVTRHLGQLFASEQRVAIEKEASCQRVEAMVKACKRAVSTARRSGEPLSVVECLSVMYKSVGRDGYRFVGVSTDLMQQCIHVLAVHVYGAYCRVVQLRDELKTYFETHGANLAKGVTRGQQSRCAVKMCTQTFIVEFVSLMSRGGVKSLVDGRELVPWSALAQVLFPSRSVAEKLLGATRRFKLEPLLHLADRVPSEFVGDPVLSFTRCVKKRRRMVVDTQQPLAIRSSWRGCVRHVVEKGPFVVVNKEGQDAYVDVCCCEGEDGKRAVRYETWAEAFVVADKLNQVRRQPALLS